jgi:hypothetical protein
MLATNGEAARLTRPISWIVDAPVMEASTILPGTGAVRAFGPCYERGMTYLIQAKNSRGAMSRRASTEEAGLKQATEWINAGMTVHIVEVATGQTMHPTYLQDRIDARGAL